MKNSLWVRIAACTGAVVGAGFASGREIVTFFTRYGTASWGLILLSSVLMGLLCRLLLENAEAWDGRKQLTASSFCVLVLMTVTAGAMISAAGQMIALLWPCRWAYSAGAAGTLLAAWKCGEGSLKRLGWVGGAAVFMLVAVLAGCVRGLPPAPAVQLPVKSTGAWIGAIAYAGMNLTLAMGVVCRCAQEERSGRMRMAAGFGMVMLVLLSLSNALYLRQPQVTDAPFPIVRLLSGFGRQGFRLSAVLLYLAVLSTLASVLLALRMAAESFISHPVLRRAAVPGIPLLLSCVGFEGIVDSVYAPAGLACLCLIFLPMFLGIIKRKA